MILQSWNTELVTLSGSQKFFYTCIYSICLVAALYVDFFSGLLYMLPPGTRFMVWMQAWLFFTPKRSLFLPIGIGLFFLLVVPTILWGHPLWYILWHGIGLSLVVMYCEKFFGKGMLALVGAPLFLSVWMGLPLYATKAYWIQALWNFCILLIMGIGMSFMMKKNGKYQ